MSNIFTYTLTREQLEKIRTDLATNQKINLLGDSGEITYSGVKVGYSFVEPTMTITILDHSWAKPVTLIKMKMDSWFKTEEA